MGKENGRVIYRTKPSKKIMKLTKEEKEKLEALYQRYLNDEKVQKMKEVPMHFGSNCYLHSFKVAKKAVRHALHYRKINLETVLVSAILHDYYLYDWRKDKEKKKHHGTRHPEIAAVQATRDFGISEAVRKSIRSHMWPLGFTHFPNNKEALILSYSDKDIAIREFLTSSKHKKKKEQKYYDYISTLFDD